MEGYTTIEHLKLWQWQLTSGITNNKKCPICSSHLTEHGWKGNHTCETETCKFNRRGKDGVHN